MQFFICGFCDKACNRVHFLLKADKKAFEKFLTQCHQKDFQQGEGPSTP